MAIVVDGKKIAGEILDNLAERVVKLKERGVKIKLGVILVGADKPSQLYVRNKGRAAERIGIDFQLYEYPAEIKESELIKEVKRVQVEDELSGLIVQLPLPKQINAQKVINYINPEKDVDCMTFFNLGKLALKKSAFKPPTPDAIMEVLRYHKVELDGKHLVMLGRGELIGKPLSLLLAYEPATLSICNASTPDSSVFTKMADIIVTGVGKKDLLTGEMVKAGAVVIDAGVCFVDGKMYGDIEFESVAKKASLVTPTPGGVGPLTVAKLLTNTVKAAETCSLMSFDKFK